MVYLRLCKVAIVCAHWDMPCGFAHMHVVARLTEIKRAKYCTAAMLIVLLHYELGRRRLALRTRSRGIIDLLNCVRMQPVRITLC